MSRLAQLRIEDIRGLLPRTPWSIGTRSVAPTSCTIHYNGPAVADRSPRGTIRQLEADARWHMQHIGDHGADGIQYHYAIGLDGTIYRCRDPEAQLWHCANSTGNAKSIAIHFVLGGAQDATVVQWQNATLLFEALIEDHAMPGGRHAVRGHREWPRSDGRPQGPCPGPKIYDRLVRWRSEGSVRTDEPLRYRIIANIDFAAVREGPGLKYPIALQGAGTLSPRTEILVDAVVSGYPVAGERRWVHLSRENAFRDIGFVHWSLVQPVAVTGATLRMLSIDGSRCRSCGDQLPDGAVFCIGCGVAV